MKLTKTSVTRFYERTETNNKTPKCDYCFNLMLKLGSFFSGAAAGAAAGKIHKIIINKTYTIAKNYNNEQRKKKNFKIQPHNST